MPMSISFPPSCRKKLKETKEIQKFRKRPVGVRYNKFVCLFDKFSLLLVFQLHSAAKLALGQKVSSEDEKLAVS